VIAEVVDTKTGRTPREVIDNAMRRLRRYDATAEGDSSP